jgi:hypothetical protein
MARPRRGGGFRPPELRGTLGTLIRNTLEQAGVVRDAIAGTARSRLDEARSHRRRRDALAELGEIVLELVHRGEIDIDELPEARAVIRQLEELDGNEPSDTPLPPTTRSRFDTRGGGDDGTVAASTWQPPFRAEKKTQIWRPTAADEPKPPVPKPELRKGGISFEDDDLADYMHPDDVPPKEPPDGDA